MPQNTSYAVMARRYDPPDSLDMFPTPPWATRALCNEIECAWGCLDNLSCWEPACGMGDMVRPLKEYFRSVYASDIATYEGCPRADFLLPKYDYPLCDWIITNPPFRLAEQFSLTAIERARVGVAMFVRTQFLEGVGRYERLFSQLPPTAVLQFTERVPIHKGKLTENGSTATAYCWVVWHLDEGLGDGPTTFNWIKPCRKRLEKPGDYPA